MKTETGKCGICGSNHSTMHCTAIQLKMHIVDKPVLPKARLSLPDELEIQGLADSSFTICTRLFIEKGTQFGPFQAKKLCTLLPSIHFPLKVFLESEDDLSEYYLDTTDEYECSWLMFVEPASNIEEQNLICFQDGDELFYAAIKDIKEGDRLKVWYSPYYACKMKKELLGKTEKDEEVQNTQSVDDLVEQKKQFVTRKAWSCKICGKVENKVTEFAAHLLGHYKAKLKRICEICNDTFLRRQDLEKHMKIVHGTNVVSDKEKLDISQIKLSSKPQCPNKQESKEKDTNLGGPLLLQDSLDNYGLFLQQTDLSQFDLNSIDNHSFENENLGLNVDSIFNENVKELGHFNLDSHDVEGEQLVCDICLKSFQNLKYLVLHMAQHTGKYACFQCNKVFARKENLSFHSCKSYYKLKCPSCNKLFFQLKALNQHIKYYHKRAFACEKCKKNYESQKKLDRHDCSSNNTAPKIFTCTICSKQFSQKGNLLTHMKLHEKIENYTCPICNKTLNSRSTYKKHEIIHYGAALTCNECNRIFTRQDTLKRHTENVHNKKPLSCEVCNKSISTKKNLKKHMLIHLENKQYYCTICSKPFRAKHNLQQHIKRVHTSKTLSDNSEEKYSCPKCHVVVKLKQSFARHIQKHHPGHDYLYRTGTSKSAKPSKIQEPNLKDDDLVLDLKQTIENMNFNTDDISNCNETDINFEIDKLLNNATNIDSLLSESNDRLVESLIDIAMNETNEAIAPILYPPKESYLSMPDLGTGT